MAEIIRKGKTCYLIYKGFIYIKHSSGNIYWRCQDCKVCATRLVVDANGHIIIVKKGGDASSHSYAPDPEAVTALKTLCSMRREATEHPEAPPARIMRSLQEAPPAVLARLPDRENIKKQIQRERLRELPTNPRSINEMREIPDKYQKTLVGDNFLLYDSYEDDDYEIFQGVIINK